MERSYSPPYKSIKRLWWVKKGNLGGFVESIFNLSEKGNCWANNNAKIGGNAKVLDNAKIYDEAEVFGYASINGNTKIGGDTAINFNCIINNNQWTYANVSK